MAPFFKPSPPLSPNFFSQKNFLNCIGTTFFFFFQILFSSLDFAIKLFFPCGKFLVGSNRRRRTEIYYPGREGGEGRPICLFIPGSVSDCLKDVPGGRGRREEEREGEKNLTAPPLPPPPRFPIIFRPILTFSQNLQFPT